MGMAAILINGPYLFSNLSFSCPRRLHMKFEQHWPSEEKPSEIINIFSIQMYGAHTNA